MNLSGQPVINLGIGSPDNPPSEEAINTLCESAKESNTHGYQPYIGIPELRENFASWYKEWYGVHLNPKNEIQPLIGSKEGILHMCWLLPAGDKVLVLDPDIYIYFIK